MSSSVILSAPRDLEILEHAAHLEKLLDNALSAYQRLADENAELHRELKRLREEK